jgi:branched-subunit amino acid aminotransferase/4-amino-4-deoxychorismate lyase
MSGGGAIAWCAGRWGPPAELVVPLDDRGLQLGDGLFETVLVAAGRPRLLGQHLARWRHSAALLGMAPPPPERDLAPLIAEAIVRAGLRPGTKQAEQPCGCLRLNWSRGSPPGGSRGIDLPPPGTAPPAHRFWLELRPLQPVFTPVRLIISASERRVAGSLLSRCKTFAYGPSIQARRQARAAGADDALLESTAGGLCCGTTANLLVRRDGRWHTPPLASGCLPGVMRGRALALGVAEEACVDRRDLETCEGAVLLNSLGCRPVAVVGSRQLAGILSPPAAETFWRRLIKAGELTR